MANATITVLEADGTTETDCVVLDVGRQAAAASKSVAMSTDDKTVLDSLATKLDTVITAVQLIDDVVGNIDVAIGASQPGIIVQAMRDDALSTLTPVEGDRVPLRTSATGALWVRDESLSAPGQATMANSASVAIASDQTNVPVTAAPKYVTVSMSTPTDAQDAGDVIAATQIVAACTVANDAPGILQSATLIDTDDVGVNIKAVFFSANTTLGTEDSAPDIDDTEALTVLGVVDFAAADFVDLGGSKYNTKTNIGLAIVPASGTDDIYMALYSPTGGTWASGVITVRLGFI